MKHLSTLAKSWIANMVRSKDKCKKKKKIIIIWSLTIR